MSNFEISFLIIYFKKIVSKFFFYNYGNFLKSPTFVLAASLLLGINEVTQSVMSNSYRYVFKDIKYD